MPFVASDLAYILGDQIIDGLINSEKDENIDRSFLVVYKMKKGTYDRLNNASIDGNFSWAKAFKKFRPVRKLEKGFINFRIPTQQSIIDHWNPDYINHIVLPLK